VIDIFVFSYFETVLLFACFLILSLSITPDLSLAGASLHHGMVVEGEQGDLNALQA
jgi:hypothetical protein